MDNIPFKKIIDYLNAKASKRFSHKSEPTRKLISGRFSEGRTLEDFMFVIDLKVGQWLDNSQMNQYLRPTTLFCPTNFEKYLNESLPESQPRRDSGDIERDDAFREWVRAGNDPSAFVFKQ